MSDLSQHSEWLSLIDVSGPFLAEPVLKQVFPQGLEQIDPLNRKAVRQAYEEWREAIDLDDPQLPAFQKAWVELVLKRVLELDEDDEEDILKARAKLSDALTHLIPEHGVTLRPDFAVVDEQNSDRPLMLIQVFSHDVNLDEPVKGDGWATSPAERMVALCRAHDVRLGLLTNGEQWMLIDAPVGAVTTFASWYARLWGQEPITLQAFVNLLGIRRFFVDPSEQLPALFDESLKLQDEVTDALGEQVRRAVEVLIQRLDRADVDLNRELLVGVEPSELYEAALTVMMRIVFLLSAEERGLLLLGDERYEANYAVSTLRMQLRSESEEILERRQDAWSRLLSMFRAVYGGIQHETMRLPALGGSLFDPDRFPFLEGRDKDSNWKTDPAKPLPIDNRTVLLLLDAVQLFQGRALSYRALDVEQIGYVYEGLLERTVVRAREVTLDLGAAKKSKKPWVTLDELDAAAGDGEKALMALLEERTGSSASRVTNDLAKKIDEAAADKLLTACHGDQALRDRIKPYFHFLRMDRWGYPLIYPENTFMVTIGADRRETGTHYTPKSLTETVVKETLEPVVYVGPIEGKPRKEWVLKSPTELLDLKICDPAMGSGAFLVQVCRWLSERLVESWDDAEKQGNAVTSEGVVVEKNNGYEPLRNDAEERLLTARRLIAERCLYGVDINPLAVELAKLSIWLVTLAKGRPFGFLDHNLRSGDSLLGVHDLEQLLNLEMKPYANASKKLFGQELDPLIKRAVVLRSELRNQPIRDIRDVEKMAELDAESRRVLNLTLNIADCMTSEYFSFGANSDKLEVLQKTLSVEVDKLFQNDQAALQRLSDRLQESLHTDPPRGRNCHTPFHWPLEFPEVFLANNKGFDAIVGNPPFLWALRISIRISTTYGHYLKRFWPHTKKNADLCSYFLLRAADLLRPNAAMGFIATNTISEADTRESGLDELADRSFKIIAARSNIIWPGSANVRVVTIVIKHGEWNGDFVLDGEKVGVVSTRLSASDDNLEVNRLKTNSGKCFKGSVPLGDGFFVDEHEVQNLLKTSDKYDEVLFKYLNGQELNTSPDQMPGRWVIYFRDWSLEKCEEFPACLDIVRERVKPVRDKIVPKNNMAKQRKELWWKFTGPTVDLYKAIRNQERVIVASAVSKYHAFTFVPANYVYSNALNVFPFDSWGDFAILQSSLHSFWALINGSKLKTDPRYNVSDCFETFPFPLNNNNPDLERLGEQYHLLRAQVMREEEIGLTKLYNRFHDQEEADVFIAELRELHRQIDEMVALAYGWDDVPFAHGFYEVDYLPENDRVRFTISKPARTEVLRRLSALNRERYEAEQPFNNSKIANRGKAGRAASSRTARSSSDKLSSQVELFEVGDASFMPEPKPVATVEQVYEWIEEKQGAWLPKQAILEGTGFDDSTLDRAIAELIADDDLEQKGVGDNARYRAKG
jgi:type I restriction-modification system DNA methylase subunit